MVKIEVIATPEVSKTLNAYIDRFFKENEGVYFNLAFYTPNGEAGYEQLSSIRKRTYSPLLANIEVNDPSFNGYEVAKFERESDSLLPLIFISKKGYVDMEKAFEHHPYSYLVYPFTYEEFVKATKDVLGFLAFLHTRNAASISFRSGTKYHEFLLDELLYVEKADHNLIFHTIRSDVKGRGRLSDIEKELAKKSKDFIKCNKGMIVNLNFVTLIDGNDLRMLKYIVPISRNEKKKVVEAFKKHRESRVYTTGRGDGSLESLAQGFSGE